MNYGMYVSASGVLVNAHRMDVLANNLANVNTPGFKPQVSDVQQRDAETVEDGTLDPELSRRMLEQLGGGLFAADHRTAFAVGDMVYTQNPLDVGLPQPGMFFAVETTDAETGRQEVQLTRNGRFMQNSDGEIVTASGDRVLDDGDAPIRVPEGTVSITISPAGEIAFSDKHGLALGDAQLQVARVDTAGLEHRGKGLFAMTTGDTRKNVEMPNVQQYHYEASGTDAVQTMMQIVAATKAATGNANMIRYHDQMMNQSVNTFARLG